MPPFTNYTNPAQQIPMNTQELLQRQIANLQSQLQAAQAQIQAQMQNPVPAPTPMPQNMPQQTGMGGINTQIVENFESISANSVPMDNNGALFAKKDGSEIQLRRWSADGKIITTSYLPLQGSENGEPDNSHPGGKELKLGLSDDATQALLNEFQNISARFDKLEQTITPVKQTRASSKTTKKEADSE